MSPASYPTDVSALDVTVQRFTVIWRGGPAKHLAAEVGADRPNALWQATVIAPSAAAAAEAVNYSCIVNSIVGVIHDNTVR